MRGRGASDWRYVESEWEIAVGRGTADAEHAGIAECPSCQYLLCIHVQKFLSHSGYWFVVSSSQEVCRAVDICQTHVKRKVEEGDLSRLCFTEGCPDVDLLIRTSGETRLSDFLNLQCRNAKLVFDKVHLHHHNSAILWSLCRCCGLIIQCGISSLPS